MKKTFYWLLLLALFTGSSCSLPHHIKTLSNTLELRPAPHIKRLSLTHFGDIRFTGLIVLRFGENTIHYALLDGMGIKLLEATVLEDQRYTVQGGIAKVSESPLPEILAEALIRIYLLHPAELPCSRSVLNTFCEKDMDDKSGMKYFRIGPFTSWRVRYSAETDNTTLYSQPWLGLVLTITEVAANP